LRHHKTANIAGFFLSAMDRHLPSRTEREKYCLDIFNSTRPCLDKSRQSESRSYIYQASPWTKRVELYNSQVQLLYFNELKFQLKFESFDSRTKFNGLITKSNLELFLSWFSSLSTLQDSELVDCNTDRKHA
jgi:hypothetical protein